MALPPYAPDERDTRHCYEIGRFIVLFSQVEFSLRVALEELLELSSVADPLVSAPDFASLCRILKVTIEAVHQGETDKNREAQQLINEILSINDNHRVAVVHGTWALGESGLAARHRSRQSFKVAYKYEKLDELIEVTNRLEALHRLLIWNLWDLPDEADGPQG
jgi:hypothetical protein